MCARVTAEVIRESPWSSVVKLAASERVVAYLKIAGSGTEAAILPQLANVSGLNVPRVLAALPEAGWVLLADHGGKQVKQQTRGAFLTAVRNYAFAQSSISTDWQPRRFAPLAPEPRLLRDRIIEAIELADHAIRECVDIQICGEVLRLLNAIGERLLVCCAGARDLPLTVNHNDLHTGNVAIRLDGTVIICDWQDAVVGPAGMSSAYFAPVGTSFGPPLFGFGVRGACGRSRAERAYFQALVQAGYATDGALSTGLTGACQWGSLVRLADVFDLVERRQCGGGDISGILLLAAKEIARCYPTEEAALPLLNRQVHVG
jgi:hypothetical protein